MLVPLDQYSDQIIRHDNPRGEGVFVRSNKAPRIKAWGRPSGDPIFGVLLY